MNGARVPSVLDLIINLQVCTVSYLLPNVMFTSAADGLERPGNIGYVVLIHF